MPRDDAEAPDGRAGHRRGAARGRHLPASTTAATCEHARGARSTTIWADLSAHAREAADRRSRPGADDRNNCHTPPLPSLLMPAFELVTDLAPAGDQPEAIAALVDGHRAGRPVPDAARHHRLGQVVHDRRRDREGPAADARAGAQQEPRRAARQRVPGAVPEEPGRVLRLLLRLLPARGVPPDDRHLHREGLVDQRRDRPAAPLGHQRAAVAAAT